MKISFPKVTIKHHRKPQQVAQPVFCVNGKILSWDEAQQVYFFVQREYDKLDVLQEVDYRLSQAEMTREEARDIENSMESILDVYRNRLDADVGDTWNRTLDGTLYDFAHRESAPYLF